jgi:hypothetical protein
MGNQPFLDFYLLCMENPCFSCNFVNPNPASWNQTGIKIFDYPKFAEPFRDMIRREIDLLVKESGVEVNLNKGGIRKESATGEVLKICGDPLSFLASVLKANKNRCLEFIAAFDSQTAGREKLSRISESKMQNNRNYKSFDFFSQEDLSILLTIVRSEFNINGLRNKHILNVLHLSAARVSRLINLKN